MVLLFRVYSSFELTNYPKVHILGLFLTMKLIFGQLEKYFELSWKSGLAETRLDGPVLPPLL